MAATTLGTIPAASEKAVRGNSGPSFFQRLFAVMQQARIAEARRQIARLDPSYARLMDVPENLRETWIKSGKWHEQG